MMNKVMLSITDLHSNNTSALTMSRKRSRSRSEEYIPHSSIPFATSVSTVQFCCLITGLQN